MRVGLSTSNSFCMVSLKLNISVDNDVWYIETSSNVFKFNCSFQMLQQATDYRIYDQAFFLSGIESAEGKEEKKNSSPPKQKGKKDSLWSQANISLGLLLSKSRKVTWIIWCPKVSVYEKFCYFSTHSYCLRQEWMSLLIISCLWSTRTLLQGRLSRLHGD